MNLKTSLDRSLLLEAKLLFWWGSNTSMLGLIIGMSVLIFCFNGVLEPCRSKGILFFFGESGRG